MENEHQTMSVKLMESQYKYIFMPQCPVYLPKLICKITWNFLGTKLSYFIHNISFKLIKNFVSFHILTCLPSQNFTALV